MEEKLLNEVNKNFIASMTHNSLKSDNEILMTDKAIYINNSVLGGCPREIYLSKNFPVINTDIYIMEDYKNRETMAHRMTDKFINYFKNLKNIKELKKEANWIVADNKFYIFLCVHSDIFDNPKTTSIFLLLPTAVDVLSKYKEVYFILKDYKSLREQIIDFYYTNEIDDKRHLIINGEVTSLDLDFLIAKLKEMNNDIKEGSENIKELCNKNNCKQCLYKELCKII